MAPRVNAARLEADRGCFTRSPRPLRRPGLDEERLLCTWGVWHARDSAPASLSLHSSALVEFKRDGMERNELTRLQGWSILCGAALMLSLAMGMRQSLGLFQPQMIRDVGVTAAQFSFAIALQNIVWGLTQPFVGMLADRWGARPIALAGVMVYAVGLCIAI